MDELKKSKLARDYSDIIYEDDNFLIVRPWDKFSANYFLSRDHWGSDASFQRGTNHLKHYYILIDKKNGDIFTLQVYSDENYLPVAHHESGSIRLIDLIDKFEPIKKIVSGLIGTGGETYQLLELLAEGGDISASRIMDSEHLISEIKIVKRLPGASKVVISFDSDEYLDLFDMDEHTRYFVDSFFTRGNYYGWSFNTSERVYEDFREGYVFRSLNNENIQILSEIAKLIDPTVKPEDILDNNTESLSQIAKTLMNLFERKADSFMNTYSESLDECYEETARNSVQELCGVLTLIGFHQKEGNCYSEFFTSLTHLLSLYKKYPMGLKLGKILRHEITEKYGEVNFEEEMWGECYIQSFNDEYLQEKMKIILEELMEEIQDSDLFVDIDEYQKVYQQIRKKFEFDKWYELPKDETRQIKFLSINPKNNKVVYDTFKKGKPSIRSEANIEEIYNILYHPELDFGD